VFYDSIDFISQKYNSLPSENISEVVVIHFAGVKPWISFREKCDIWWEYYRKSVFFNDDFYNNYFRNENIFDNFSIKVLLKIILRKIWYRIMALFNFQ
jgi:hypothetical protein